VSFDVFEHLPEPLEAARRLVGCLRPGGILIQTGCFMDEGYHPCHLAAGIRRFGGVKWTLSLAGLGLRGRGAHLLVKMTGPGAWAQRLRYGIWRATGLWITVPYTR
jgi:hypothetical protein